MEAYAQARTRDSMTPTANGVYFDISRSTDGVSQVLVQLLEGVCVWTPLSEVKR